MNKAANQPTSSSPQQKEKLLFEYPLKENIRGFLRLESLFTQFERNRLAVHSDNHLHALKLFFEILEILERGDTRSELIKELTRLSTMFETLRKSPEVDVAKLDNFLKQVTQLYQWVIKYQGKFGDKLRKEPFIETVKHRASIPGGTCTFDCPDLFLFLSQPHDIRQNQLNGWLEDIRGVKTSIEVILRIMRDSGHWHSKVAPLGSFLIETNEQPVQLLRLKLDQSDNLFPEFSCGKHRSNIHFMRFNQQHRKVPVQKEIGFELACCY
ncbi:cell division protein ZapD [Aliikangiella coralliicola]|uniref:Cell division protein ZapD n=1 Tax=Aliikangiella coralliicola TaxID=2592383 RepID=A0A545TZX4_9GAMM|nr:cell division protein ZapD [Aliikangiella coralliicola]TQV82768.1 cell division protein ZapD [Aliikangiella coralliicola]